MQAITYMLAALSNPDYWSGGWVGLYGFTPFVFYMALRNLRRHWPRPRLWLAAAGLLVVHVAAFVAILRAYPPWRMIWYAPISVAEIVGVSMLLELACRVPQGQDGPR